MYDAKQSTVLTSFVLTYLLCQEYFCISILVSVGVTVNIITRVTLTLNHEI